MFILIGARVFALTFYGISTVTVWVEELLLAPARWSKSAS